MKKGNHLKIKIVADTSYFSSTGNMQFGYIYNNEQEILEKFYIQDEKELDFKCEADGEYEFFLRCCASDPIIIKFLSFK